MKIIKYILSDWSANVGNPKIRVVLLLYRVANLLSGWPWPFRFISLVYCVIYRVVVEWILVIEIPWKTKIGEGLTIYHGQGLVIHDKAVIGKRCVLRHGVTIGMAKESCMFGENCYPVVGDNVIFGCNAVVIGGISVGANSIIAAGAIVIRDVPELAVVAGNPARVVKLLK